MLIVNAYRDLISTSVDIATRFHVSDTYAHEVFDRFVKLDRLPLTDAISFDEVHIDIDDNVNGPIESMNRKVKDLRRSGRGFRDFEHFRNRFLYATRKTPVLNGVSDYNPVTYFEDDDF